MPPKAATNNAAGPEIAPSETPNPATNAEVTAALGELLGRPTVLPVPAFALRLGLGEFSTEILGSHRVLPTRLVGAGFAFEDPTIVDALSWARSTR